MWIIYSRDGFIGNGVGAGGYGKNMEEECKVCAEFFFLQCIVHYFNLFLVNSICKLTSVHFIASYDTLILQDIVCTYDKFM